MSALSVTFRSLRYRNFKLFFFGQSISLIGTWMERIAINWLVYTNYHSVLLLGIVNFVGQIPTLLLSPYGGAISDRHNRYKILLITQVSAMVQTIIMALLVLTHSYNFLLITLLSVALGIINAFDTPSRQSLMIRLIDDKKDLPNAIALNSTMVNLARLLGPAVAGILLTTVGTGICFVLNALSFVAVIISLLLMRLTPEVPIKITTSVWQGLKDGYNYLKHTHNIKLMILLMAFTSLFLMSYGTLMPVFAKDIFHGNAITYSLLNSLSGLGALGGAIYMAGLKNTQNLQRTVIYSCLLFGVSIALFSLSSHLWLALIFIMLAGTGMMMQIAGTNTFIQTNVNNDMRGRVISYYVMAFQGMQPIGSFFVGLGGHHASVRVVLFIMGVSGFVIAAIFGLYFRKTANKLLNRRKENIITTVG